MDFVSNGRFGLNVVTGASVNDFRLFGMKERPPGSVRYDRADEFVTMLKYLWAYDDPVDFEGEHYQCYGGYVAPKPVRRPRPILMNAGQSDTGFDFACRQADWVFVVPPKGRLDDYAALVEKAHKLAARYERKVRVGAMCYAVIEETDTEATGVAEWLVREGDREAIRTYMHAVVGTASSMQIDDESDPYVGLGKEQFGKVVLGMTASQLIGSYQTVAEKMRELHQVGVDNLVIGFLDPRRGLEQMEGHVMPILKRMGLRR